MFYGVCCELLAHGQRCLCVSTERRLLMEKNIADWKQGTLTVVLDMDTADEVRQALLEAAEGWRESDDEMVMELEALAYLFDPSSAETQIVTRFVEGV